ncbi:MAG: hypothetical protein A2161_06135 [Candidatus Schekmanbacteria bacterium RBG_13_48_7]|uniref:ATPase AAA-type core domain-containing protein n=1 Tax=Candidatus Schekmanbacteria bacterium RBG_13_48_7 TaxID=1817878 RepID=A0A1F7RRV4_9BACT|nr:MAG: hypothetical protein A2161_06135 [Candidatus Schekmanbacteria bacterium RBG_13_48_7]
MIRRILIKGYKSFKETKFELRPFTVILGANSSGKTNFLDTVKLLSRMATCNNLQEAFSDHRGLPLESLYNGDGDYETLLKQAKLQFTIEADVEISHSVRKKVEGIIRSKRKGIDPLSKKKWIVTDTMLRYRLTIELLPDSGQMRVMDERLSSVKRKGEEKKRNPFLERVKNRMRLRMESKSHPIYHEIGLDRTIVSTALYEPQYPHITAFRMELDGWKTYNPVPEKLITPGIHASDLVCLASDGENVATFLSVLKNGFKKEFEKFNTILKRIYSSDVRIDIQNQENGKTGLRFYENGIWFSSDLISGGTLRLIGILAAINPLNSATMVSLEEPENGLQPSQIQRLGEVIQETVENHRKQIILTTHSPVFPETIEDQNIFICRKENHQTFFCPFETPGPVFKRQSLDRALENQQEVVGTGASP